MTTTTPTIDSIADAILARCESPNTIETGLTSTPIDDCYDLNVEYEDYQKIITIIGKRFPVICSHVTRYTENHYSYTFILADMPRYVGYEAIRLEIKYGKTGGGEYEISTTTMNISSVVEATAYAKAINAIAEFAQTQVAS